MSLTQSARSVTHIDDRGRIALHPRMMKKLGIGPGTEVRMCVRLGDLIVEFVDDRPPYLDRNVDVSANARALGQRIRAARAARGETIDGDG